MNTAIIYRVLAVAILAAAGAHRYFATRMPVGTEAYHARVRAAAEKIPTHIGSWVGHDVPIEARALSVLKPNVMISREYVNVENGIRAGFTFTHCADAHDMAGHFPPRCYPANGWTSRAARPHDWRVGDLLFTGMEYEYYIENLGRSQSTVVANCMLLPSGQIVRDMDGIARSIAGIKGQWSGTGQFQVHFDSSVTEEQRDEAVRSLIQGYLPVITAVLDDVAPQGKKP
jgi:hypothetical protein